MGGGGDGEGSWDAGGGQSKTSFPNGVVQKKRVGGCEKKESQQRWGGRKDDNAYLGM